MKKVSKKTIIRTVLMIVSIINLALNLAGKKTLPFTNDEISLAVAAILDVAATFWAWWKNNSFTPAAIAADEYKESLTTDEYRGGGSDIKTSSGLVAYAKKQLGKPYWDGCFGQTSTKSLYKAKKSQYPDQYTWECPTAQLNKRVHDCVGLIKGYLWSDDANAVPKYNPSQDVSANGMLSACKKKGKIKKMPDVPGVLVFKSGHVGVYIGNGKVIEAMGHAYGVVETELSKRPWTHYGCCPWIEYTEPEKPKESKKYYPKYTGNSVSIVDALVSLGVDASFSHRKKIAKANGITGYIGKAKQNIKMLDLLKAGKLIKE